MVTEIVEGYIPMISCLWKSSRASVTVTTTENSRARICIRIETSLVMGWRYGTLIDFLLLISQLPLTAIDIMIYNIDRIVLPPIAL